jgi:hypothetical protein
MQQLHLIPTPILEQHLIAKSVRNAFYILRLVECAGAYWIEKESGTGDKILDRRTWPMKSREAALKFFNRKIREKTNPGRGSPRKYKKARAPGRGPALKNGR